MPNSFRQKPHDRIADWRTSGQGLAALRDFGPANDRIGSKAGIRRGQLNVRFTPDCVAKLFAAPRKSNCRMRLNAVLNRCCAPVLVLEPRLPNLAAKIVLQHNPPISGHRSTRRACPLGARNEHRPGLAIRPDHTCNKRATQPNLMAISNDPRTFDMWSSRRSVLLQTVSWSAPLGPDSLRLVI